jgi:hypothetical protein
MVILDGPADTFLQQVQKRFPSPGQATFAARCEEPSSLLVAFALSPSRFSVVMKLSQVALS